VCIKPNEIAKEGVQGFLGGGDPHLKGRKKKGPSHGKRKQAKPPAGKVFAKNISGEGKTGKK